MSKQSSEHLTIYWVNQYAVPPDQPGGTRHYDLAAALEARGHSVVLVASDLNLPTRSYSRRRDSRELRAIRETVQGVTFMWLPAGSYRKNDWRRVASMLVFAVATFLSLLRVPVSRGRTVFIGSSPHLFGAFATLVAARLRGVPFVLEVRDLWPESYIQVSGKSTGPEIRLMRWIAILLYRAAARIIILAEPNREAIEEAGGAPSKILYVPNGVKLDGFLDERPARTLATNGQYTFVYAGAHGPANDLETVLRACALLERSGEERIRVVLMGDGPDKDRLRSLSSDLGLRHVEFQDPVPKRQIGPTLATADAGLMVLADVPLFATGVSPNKLFDYLAAGLPVLTNVPGLVAGIVKEANAGLVVSPGSPEALAEGMLEMARQDESSLPLGTEQFIRDNFDRDKLAHRLELALLGVCPH